jgi:hypothetical protein
VTAGSIISTNERLLVRLSAILDPLRHDEQLACVANVVRQSAVSPRRISEAVAGRGDIEAAVT